MKIVFLVSYAKNYIRKYLTDFRLLKQCEKCSLGTKMSKYNTGNNITYSI